LHPSALISARPGWAFTPNELGRPWPQAGKPDDPTPAAPQPLRLLLLHYPEALPGCRVEDPPVAKPEGDVVGPFPAVGDQVAGPLLACRHRLARLLLLPGVSRHDLPRQPVGEVDEPRAVDP